MASNMNELFLEDSADSPLLLEYWHDTLIWCPSQCYYHLQRNGIDFILYLRWRWEDPWQAHVIRNAASLNDLHGGKASWSEDVFLENNLFYRDEELDQAKTGLIELFNRGNGEFPERKPHSTNRSKSF
jgi:hypothetical protein